jgi:mono/diheme cytochrome c family protein
MLQRKMGIRVGVLIAGAALFAALVVPVALGRSSAAPSPKDLAAGKSTFVSTCGACHKLAKAGTVGTIGPDLGKIKPPLTTATLTKAITLGGAKVMTKAQLAKYQTQMTPYKGVLSTKQILQVAQYIASVTGAKS